MLDTNLINKKNYSQNGDFHNKNNQYNDNSPTNISNISNILDPDRLF